MPVRLAVALLKSADYRLGASLISYSLIVAYNSINSMLEATLMYMSLGLRFLRLFSSSNSFSESS